MGAVGNLYYQLTFRLHLSTGYSYLTNEHGLALDNIEALEIVLSSGKVLTISESSHSDLFHAVKVNQILFRSQTLDADALLILQGGYNNFVRAMKARDKTL